MTGRSKLLTSLFAFCLAALLLTPAADAANPNISLQKNAPAKVLIGEASPVTLTASNPKEEDRGYNLTFRDVLPEGVEYVAGSGSVAPRVIEDAPSAGKTTLIFENVSDLSENSKFSVTYSVKASPTVYSVGQSYTNEAEALINENPREVPKFDPETGLPVPETASATATAQATTKLIAVEIKKEDNEPPEGELLRGVHEHQTVYTLHLRNNQVEETTNIVVDDYLPAALEFLECGEVDNTTDAPTNPGSAEEYPQSGPIDPGNAPAAPACVEPDLVETVETDPDGAGPLKEGVYTHVRWTLAAPLAVGAEHELQYVAAVPIRENTLDWGGGGEPTPASLEQAANLDNNSGAETFDEQALTNYSTVSGKYEGALEVEDDDSLTLTAEDLAIQKSVSPTTINSGVESEWKFHIETSEYRYAKNIRLVDTLPNGLCPLGEENYEAPTQLKSECEPSGAKPSAEYAEVEELASGEFRIEWNESKAPELAEMGPSETLTIEFPTQTRVFYQSEFEDDEARPILTGDRWVNHVAMAGADFVRCAPEDPRCAKGEPTISHDEEEGTDDTDVSDAEQQAEGLKIDKKVRQPGGAMPVDCETGTYVDGPPPLYGPGDQVCWQLNVTFASNLFAGKPIVSDFIPPDEEYLAGSAHEVAGVNTVNVEGFEENGNVLEWTLGPAVESGAKVFEWRFATIMGKSPSTEPFDVEGNLMKFAYADSEGETFPERDQVEVERSEPALKLLKGVYKVNGEPAGGNPKDTEGLEVHGGDVVTYRLDLENTGNRDAQEIELWDDLAPGIECADVSNVSDGGTCNVSANRIEWTGLAVPAEGEIPPVTYDVKIPTDVAPAQTYVNHAGVRSYTSATNTGTPFRYIPGSNIDPEVEADLGEAPNSDPVDDTASVHTAAAELSKTRTTETVQEPGNDGPGQATIGEVVDYEVKATVPAGSTIFGTGKIVDALGTRLVLVPGSAEGHLGGGALPAEAEVVESGNTVELRLPPEYLNPEGTGPDVFELKFKAVVADVASNARPGSVSNLAGFEYEDQEGNPQKKEASVGTEIVEPQVSLTKSQGDADGHVEPGETVHYTLRASNSSAAQVSAANDLVLVDTVPEGLTPVNGTTPVADGGTVEPDGGVWDETARTISWEIETLARGGATELEYDLRVNDPANSGSVFRNEAQLTATSLLGEVPGERTAASPTHAGYEAKAEATVGLIEAQMSKSVTPEEATIGEALTYTLDLRLPPEIEFHDTTVEDHLPDGIDFDGPGSIECVGGCGIGGVELTPEPQADGSTKVAWFLGDIAPSGAEREVKITYGAHVDTTYEPEGTPVKAGEGLENTAATYYDSKDHIPGTPATIPAPGEFEGTTGDVSSEVEVVEPKLAIEKEVSGDEDHDGTRLTQPGDSYTYTLIVTNEGSSPAYEATVRDTNPDALLRNVQPTTGAGFLPAGWQSGDPLVWTIPGPIGPGESVTLAYTAELAPSAELEDGDTIDNTGDVPTYWGVPKPVREAEGFEYRTYEEDPEDSVELEVSLPHLSLTKAPGRAGGARIGESFPWKVTIENTASDAVAKGIDVSDVLPPNWSYDAGSASFDEGIGARDPSEVTPSPTGDALSWSNVTDLAPGGKVVLTFEATPGTEAATDPGSGVGNPNVNQASVSGEDAAGATSSAEGPYSAEGEAQVILEVPGLEIEKTPDGATAVAGEAYEYTIVVTNSGEAPATGVEVDDTFSAGNVYSEGTATASPSAGFAEAGYEADTPGAGETRVHWTLGTIEAGESVTITVPIEVPASVADGATLRNDAAVHSNELPTPESDEGSYVVQREADVSITKNGSPASVEAGEGIEYTLHVANAGPSDAAGVSVEDVLPAGEEFVSADSPCANAAGTVTCSIGNLAAGESHDYAIQVKVKPSAKAEREALGMSTTEIENTATVSSTTDDPEPGNNSSSTETTLEESADVGIEKSGPTLPVVQGNTFTYTLTVTNAGPSDAESVQVSDPLPGEVSFEEIETDTGTCGEAAGTVECDLGTLAPGAEATIVITVKAEGVGSFENEAEVSTTTDDPEPDNNEDEVETTVEPAADLSVVKTAPAKVAADADLIYSLEVANAGPSDATGVVVTDPLPAGTQFVSADAGCEETAATVVCDVGALPVGETVSFQITVHVPLSLAGATLTNTATVEGEQTDPNSPNDSGTVSTEVGPAADLQIVKTMGAAQAGEKLTYTLLISNHGPSESSAVTVHDALPAGVTFDSASPSQGSCSAAGPDVTCELGPLAANASAQIGLVVDVSDGAAGQTLRNTATVEGPEPDPVPENNTSTVEGRVAQPRASKPNLRVVKTADDSNPEIGVPFHYKVTVSNIGEVKAEDVVVKDTMNGPVQVLDVSPDKGSCEKQSAGRVTCRIHSLAAGSSAHIEVTVVAERPGPLTNTASASDANGETQPADNSDQAKVSAVAAKTDFSLRKGVSRRVVRGGGKVSFQIVLRAGEHALSDVRVCDPLPASLVFVSAPGAGFDQGRACWTRPYLKPHGVMKLRLVARAVRGYSRRRARNVAHASARNGGRRSAAAPVLRIDPSLAGKPGGVTG
jgi:uncharacterized repeat protein (TIGR01451 family)/fimbrial isopeptide formation D2 family protein